MLTGIVLIVRTIILYLLMLLLIYLQKKDQNKKLLILDKVILLLIIVINSNLILNYDINVLIYIIPIITLLLLREVTRLILIDNNNYIPQTEFLKNEKFKNEHYELLRDI